MGLISKAAAPPAAAASSCLSFSLKELSPAQPYETDRPREKERRSRRTEERAFVREGEKGGGLFVAAVVVRFSHCVPSCDIRLNGRRPPCRPIWRPGRMECRGRTGRRESILEGRKWKHAIDAMYVVRTSEDINMSVSDM